MPQRGIGKTGRGNDRELSSCNSHRRELTGSRELQRVGGGRSDRMATTAGRGGRVWTLEVASLGLQNGIVLMLF